MSDEELKNECNEISNLSSIGEKIKEWFATHECST